MKITNLADKENNIFKALKSIQQNINDFINDHKNNEKALKEFNDWLNEALLEIAYLFKHASFEDENECRVIYITNLDNGNINSTKDPEPFNLYMNYQNQVQKYLSHIIPGPCCDDKDILKCVHSSKKLDLFKEKLDAPLVNK